MIIGTGYAVRVTRRHGPIKIGYASYDVAARVRVAGSSCPYPTEWIAKWESTKAEDKALLRELSPHRLKGEWFKPTAAVIDAISMRCVEFDAKMATEDEFKRQSRTKFLSFFYRVKKERRGIVRSMAAAEIAASVGCEYDDVTRWVEKAGSCRSKEIEDTALAWVEAHRHATDVMLLTQATRFEIARRRNEPRMDLLRAIHAETGGKVAPNDFLEKVDGRRQ